MVMENDESALVTLFSETDALGTILFANEAFCNVSKYKKDELVGKSHNIVRHPDMPNKLFELLWATIKSGKIFKAIIKNKAKDGTHYWVQATIMPVPSRNSDLVKYIGVRHLITDEKRAEKMFVEQSIAIS
jgi:PAS domain S-box-containing protein